MTMNDKIEKASSHVLERQGRGSLTLCLLDIREKFQTDKFGATEIVISHSPATEAKPHLVEHMKDLRLKYGRALLEEALDIILDELEGQRKAEPSLYLVNVETGRSVCPISSSDVVHLPNYVGNDGLEHPSNPIVHPKVSSELALEFHSQSKVKKMRLAAEKNPQAYDHIFNPSKILEDAKGILSTTCEIVTKIDGGKTFNVEFGHENADMSQPINPNFHRAKMLSIILARKVIDLMGDPRKKWTCAFGELRVESTSKLRWFTVDVSVDA